MSNNVNFYKCHFENTELNIVPCSVDGESKVLLTTWTPDSQLTVSEALDLAMKLKLAAHEAESLQRRK